MNDFARDQAHHHGSLCDQFVPLRPFQRCANDLQETSSEHESFAMQMKLEPESVSASDLNTSDRQVIRVDVPPTHAGIMAALRRAFEAAASEPCDRDFAELLRKLN
ncbi:MAG: hypothetical protein JOZ20_00075 [Sphingomonas sp.]|nr:hypothetical protein [Sphingomonas sp.]MBW0006747.1 hypothetical protein [Sphingomonas sp.]